jgi:protein-disulfide isomerase
MLHKSCLTLSMLVLSLAFVSRGAQPAEAFSGLALGGSANAPIKMEVFSDFECPGCREFYREVVRPVLQDYASKDKVCVIYYEFPLNKHKHAREAARYCEAAYKIGRDQALKVMDALFTDQGQWILNGNIEKIVAKALSPKEMKALKTNLNDPSIDSAIDQGIQLGKMRAVSGTPTMFVYYWGKKQRVENPQLLLYQYFKKDFLDKILQ